MRKGHLVFTIAGLIIKGLSQKVCMFGGLRNGEYMQLMFKIETLICQLKAYLDTKILFGKITHLSNAKVGKMSLRGCLEKRILRSILLYFLVSN